VGSQAPNESREPAPAPAPAQRGTRGSNLILGMGETREEVWQA
jgi:hypothetical protein